MKFIKILLAFSVVFSFSASATDIKITDTDNHLAITEKSLTEFTFVNHLSDIQTMMVKTKAGNFVKLIVSGYGENAKHGNAELPVLEELINVPMGAEVVIQILNKEVYSLSSLSLKFKRLSNESDKLSSSFLVNRLWRL